MSQPDKIVVFGVREGRAGAKRAQVFNKDWLYLHMQSEHGCNVTVNVSFKTELAPIRNAPKPVDTSTKGAASDKGPSSPKGKQAQAAAAKTTTENAEEQDFSQWDLGRGKIQQKRENLQRWLSMLMEKNNTKLKKMHDRYCMNIKKRRNRPGGEFAEM